MHVNITIMDLRIKELISNKGITLKDLAIMSGISQSNLTNYLKGNISPTLDTLKKIANALNVEIVDLFKEKQDLSFYVKLNDNYVEINKNDIVNILNKKIQVNGK